MTESALTPHTAPRTLEGLMQETSFKLRMLITDMGGLASDDQKMAWHQLTNSEQRANYALQLLKQWDAANPGAATPPTNGVHVPVPAAAPTGFAAPQNGFAAPQQGFVAPQPVQPVPAAVAAAPMGPPPVSPQAAAQAAAALQGGDKSSRRQPRNNGVNAPPADADLGAQVFSMLQTILTGLETDASNRMVWQKHLTDMLEEAASSKGSRVTALEQKYGELQQALRAISSAQQAQQKLQIWTLMAFCTLAEQQTGASVVQILRTAIDDAVMFDKLVDQAGGKV